MTVEELMTAVYKFIEGKLNPWVIPYTFLPKHLPGPPEIPEIPNKYDLTFIWEISYKIANNKTISVKQAELLLKIIPKYKTFLVTVTGDEQVVDAILNNPVFKNKPYETTVFPREVRKGYQNTLLFRFPYNPKIVDAIKAFNDKNSPNKRIVKGSLIQFLKDYALWEVIITEETIDSITTIISTYGFNYDEEVELYLLECYNNFTTPHKIEIDGQKLKITVYNDEMFHSWIKSNS